MRKLIVSVIVVVIAGAGGYFGLDYWAQNAVAREVDAMLDGWRASIGSATRGRVELDLWARTVKVSDVVVQPLSGPHPKITMAQVVVSGLGLSGKPAHMEIIDLAVSDVLPGQPDTEVVEKAPRVTLTDFSARPFAPFKVATALDGARLWLEQLSAITAARIEIPSLTLVLTQNSGGQNSAPRSTEYTYTNLILRDVHDGKIAEATTDGIALSGKVGPPFYVLTGTIGKSSILDADVAPVLALLDPSRPTKAQGYQRVYRQLSMGPYVLRMGLDGRANLNMGMTLDGVTAEDIGINPGKLSLDDLMFLSEISSSSGIGSPGPIPIDPGQLTLLLDKLAGLYEGIGVGKLDMQGLSVSSMGEQFRLAGIRVARMENGRLGELSFDGFNFRPPFGDPVSFGRIALKGFDLANFMRLMGTELAAAPGQPPGLDRLLAMQSLLEGFELKGIVVPDPATGHKVLIDASVTSGQPVGTVPTDVRASFKVSTPLGSPNPEPFINMLAAAGLSILAAEADLGLRWNEATETLALEPATLEVGSVVALTVKTSLSKATRDLFSADVRKALDAAVSVEIGGPIEITLRDLGVIDILAGEAARSKGQPSEQGRNLLLEQFTLNVQQMTQLYPGSQVFYDAVGRFLQGKGETLTVRLTPRGRVRVLALIDALRLSSPQGALLAAFTVEASSTAGGAK